MTMRERTMRIEAANRASRAQYIHRAYTAGWEAPRPRNLGVEAARLLPTLIAGLALLALALKWLGEQI